MDRRNFLKITAATGAGATLAGCGNPEHQLIRFIPDDTFTPGVATWKPSICPVCPAACGVNVRIMDGDAEVIRNGQSGIVRMSLAKKLEGNPEHPISQGKLCARGQAAIQLTYHPDRIRQPLQRTGDRFTGAFQPIGWDEAISILITKLDELITAGDQQALAFLTRPLSGQRGRLISEFLSQFGAPEPTTFEVFEEGVLRRANAQSFGVAQLPTLDLARSRYVLSFGADFLGTWNSPVAQSVAFGEMRQGRPGVRAKFVQIEPRMSQTGANADEWVPAKVGTEGVVALGIAHVLLRSNPAARRVAAASAASIEGWMEGLPAYTPEAVEKRTGVSASRIERIAAEFAENAPAIAIIGGAPLAQTNGMFQALAVNALNALAGTVGSPGGIHFTPQPATGFRTAARGRALRDVASELLSRSSAVRLLLLNDTNPVFGSPKAWRIREALSTIPFIVSFGSFLDETSILADLVLPNHSFLESWSDDVPESGTSRAVVSLAAPVMKPIHQTRSMFDVLLETGRRLSKPVPLASGTYEEMLQTSFASLPAPPTADGTAGTDAWAAAQAQGGWWAGLSNSSRQTGARPAGLRGIQAEARFDGGVEEYPFHFLPFASQAFYDGSVAHLPWLQELPDVLTTAMWSTWVEINPQTASEMGIVQGDLLEITSTQGTIEAPALLSPGIAPDVVAMPVGQGHETFTRYASGRGANPISIVAPLVEDNSGSLAWAATRVKIRAIGKADRSQTNRLVLFGTGMTEHPEEHR